MPSFDIVSTFNVQEVDNASSLGTKPLNGLWGYYPTNI